MIYITWNILKYVTIEDQMGKQTPCKFLRNVSSVY